MPRCTSSTKSGQRCKAFCKKGEIVCHTHTQITKCNEEDSKTCPICLDNICKKQSTTLKCEHTFCTSCIIAWLDSDKITCPMCRKQVTHKEYFKLMSQLLMQTLLDTNISSQAFRLAIQTPVPMID